MLPWHISVWINQRPHKFTNKFNFYRSVIVRNWVAEVTEWSGWYQMKKLFVWKWWVLTNFYHCSNIIPSVRNVFWDLYYWFIKKNSQMPSDYPVTCKSENIDKWSQILMNKLDLHIPIIDWLYGAHLNSIYHYYKWFSIFM